MKYTLLLAALLLSGCAGWEDRVPHYFAIADSVLENAPVEEGTEAPVELEE